MEIGFWRQKLALVLKEVRQWNGFTVIFEEIKGATRVEECGGGGAQAGPHQPEMGVGQQGPTHLHLSLCCLKGLCNL